MPHVVAVSRRSAHGVGKEPRLFVRLIAGEGVEGDAHRGATVMHRSRRKRDPSLPNLRQVHLLHQELLDELRARGFAVGPGVLGENLTTGGLDLLGLPRGARLSVGEAELEITGLRNPCRQLEGIQPGLMEAVLDRSPEGDLVRRAGVMAVVLRGGVVRPGAAIGVELPAVHRPLAPV